MSAEQVFTNAQIVTRDACFAGTIVVDNTLIASVDHGKSRLRGSIDLDGDFLIPGLVELHTDNVERHFMPRPGVRWPRQSAVLAHDAQIAASGITTVLDAIALGDINPESPRVLLLRDMAEAVRAVGQTGLSRAEHFLHLRCELTFTGVVDAFNELSAAPLVRLVSLMDHTPGQRQFVDVDKYRTYYKGKYHLNDEQVEVFIERQCAAHELFAAYHRDAILAICRERDFPLASHDDATSEHVEDAAAAGMVISEFPTTVEAAKAARNLGLKVLMGAPNLVMGKSHSGNVSAEALAAAGLLDILSSDYVPASLLQGAFMLARKGGEENLPNAIAMVSTTPASVIGFNDRGEIAPGKRGDFVRVRSTPAGPVVRAVWRQGGRIA